MAEVLAKKQRIRGRYRSSATRTISEVYETIEAITDTETHVTKLMQCKVSLEETLKQIYGEILELVSEDDITDEIEEVDVFTEKIQRIIIDVSCAMKQGQATTAITTTAVTPPTSGRRSPLTPPVVSITGSHGTKVKLPKLALKKFNGDLTKWTTFWDIFESAIDTNPDLTDIDKFNYLNSLLEGAAFESVSGLKLTAANYTKAMTILNRRFGNKQQLVNNHMEGLLNIDAVTLHYNIKGLRHLYEVVESQIRGLKSLGISAESYGNLLSSILMNKLPQELRLIISREIQHDKWEIEQIMEIIEREVDARERASSLVTWPRSSTRELPTATSLMSSDSCTPRCCYYKHLHPSTSCRAVTDVAQRK